MTSDVNVEQLWDILHREVIVQYPYRTAGVLFLWSYYPQFPFRILRFGLYTAPLYIANLPFRMLYFGLYVVPRSIIRGILACLGFQRGIRADSFASNYQSHRYGGYTPRNSMFSKAQSYGAINGDGLYSYENEDIHPIWDSAGWLLYWGSFVVLWKYGPLRTE
ncbi:hypothetical protein BJ912DRAFT_528194 [Pholiota molesta]|nr:hypothetical protein BJ912DRAFT_528194 [Pholiota molesta]